MSNDTEAALAALQRSFDNLAAAAQHAIDVKNKEIAALSAAHNALSKRAEQLEADNSRADIVETQLHIALHELTIARAWMTEARAAFREAQHIYQANLYHDLIPGLDNLIARCPIQPAKTPVVEGKETPTEQSRPD